MDRTVPSTYTLGWHTHRWSGWPGAFCLDCGIEDPLEWALVSDRYETWMYHPPSCPFCPSEKIFTRSEEPKNA